MRHIIISLVIIGVIGFAGYALWGHQVDAPVPSLFGNGTATSTQATDTSVNTAQTAPPATTSVANVNTPSPLASQNKQTNNIKNHMVTIDTNYGKIVFETYDTDAPNTVTNFVTLTEKGFYNGVIFHRVIKGFMIQGGDPTGTGTGGPGYKFADELNPATPSYQTGYKKGVVAMANAGPNTNGSQFFIMAADYPLPNNYTIFGKVVSGQDVVDTIDNVQTGANDKPVTPVVMKSVVVN